MSDLFRALPRPARGLGRRWTTAMLAVGVVAGMSVQTGAATAATTTTQTTTAPATTQPATTATPYMGWDTYYTLGGAVTQSSVESVADFLLSSGLAKAGYDYVWLDGGWQDDPPRNAAGQLQPNPAEFPRGIAYTFGPRIADSWRTDTDIAYGTPTAGEWQDVVRNIDDNEAHPEAEGPGHYNDPDYLIPMRTLASGGYELNETQSIAQFEMQDPLDIQGVPINSTPAGPVYSKVLEGNGRRAIVLLNTSDTPQSMTVDFADAGLSGSVRVRDPQARQDEGTYTTSYTATVPATGSVMLVLTGTDAEPGISLGGHATGDPALARVNDTDQAVFVRGPGGRLEEQANPEGTWTDLGGPVNGRIVGQPAAYANSDGSLDLFVTGTDGQIWTITADGQWAAIGTPPGLTVYGRPSAVTDGTITYVAVRVNDDSIWLDTSEAGQWSGWFERTEFTSDDYNGAFGVAAGDDGYAWISYRGIDGHVHLIEL